MSDSFDADYMEHVRTWRGFTRLIVTAVALVVIALTGLALTLL